MSIFEQYYIFKNSKLVIAQHGAALANIIFMEKKCSVLEIIYKEQLKENWFLELSKSCNKLNYFQYLTNEESSIINLNNFNFFIKKENIFNEK
jgi:capsular polysaccharide biosynthesis protein